MSDFVLPEVSDVDVAFPCGVKYYLPYSDKRLEPFKSGSNIYSRHFASLFYKGGKLNQDGFLFKPEYASPEMRSKVMRAFRVIAGTWDSKHEHKVAMCGYFLSYVLTHESEAA